MKRIISVLLALLMVLSVAASVGAEATKEPRDEEKVNTVDKSKYLFYEDFSDTKVNQKPLSFSSITEGTDTSLYVVKEKNEAGVLKNLLKVDDKGSSGNLIFQVPIKGAKGKVLIETKFKFVQTEDDYMSFGFDVMSGKNLLSRIIQWSSGGTFNAFSDAGVNIGLTPAKPESNQWYTMQVLMDVGNGLFDVQLESECMKDVSFNASAVKFDAKKGVTMLKGASVYTTNTGEQIDSVKFQTTSNRGEMYFDYIAITDNVKELEYKGEKPKPLALPMKETPKGTIIPGITNVNFKGEYLFFTQKPFEEGGSIYVPVRSLASAYGLSTDISGMKCNLSGSVKVNADCTSGKITVDGKEISGKAIFKNRTVYLPVASFVEAMGDMAVYENGLVTVTGKE